MIYEQAKIWVDAFAAVATARNLGAYETQILLTPSQAPATKHNQNSATS